MPHVHRYLRIEIHTPIDSPPKSRTDLLLNIHVLLLLPCSRCVYIRVLYVYRDDKILVIGYNTRRDVVRTDGSRTEEWRTRRRAISCCVFLEDDNFMKESLLPGSGRVLSVQPGGASCLQHGQCTEHHIGCFCCKLFLLPHGRRQVGAYQSDSPENVPWPFTLRASFPLHGTPLTPSSFAYPTLFVLVCTATFGLHA